MTAWASSLRKLRSLGLDGIALSDACYFRTMVPSKGVRGLELAGALCGDRGLKGMRMSLQVAVFCVPAIAWWPGTITAGTSTQAITTFWDVLPTFAELIGRPELAIGDRSALCIIGQPSARKQDAARGAFFTGAVGDMTSLRDAATGSGCITRTKVSRGLSVSTQLEDPNRADPHLASKHPDVMLRVQQNGG